MKLSLGHCIALLLVLSIAPAAFAAGFNFTPISDIVKGLIDLINNFLVPLVFALAFIVFIFGVFQYFIQGAASEEKRKEGQQFILYGIIGFAIMISFWGLVNLVVTTFGFSNNARPTIQLFNGSYGNNGSSAGNSSSSAFPSGPTGSTGSTRSSGSAAGTAGAPTSNSVRSGGSCAYPEDCGPGQTCDITVGRCVSSGSSANMQL